MKLVVMMFSSMILLTNAAEASHVLRLSPFDQAKLGELLERLPETLVERSYYQGAEDSTAVIHALRSSRMHEAFSIDCDRFYYRSADYPSRTRCQVMVNLDHPSAILNHDVVRVTVKDQNTVLALRGAIPYGTPQKKFYSYERSSGTEFNGTTGTVFNYQFICASRTCWIKFSKKVLFEVY